MLYNTGQTKTTMKRAAVASPEALSEGNIPLKGEWVIGLMIHRMPNMAVEMGEGETLKSTPTSKRKKKPKASTEASVVLLNAGHLRFVLDAATQGSYGVATVTSQSDIDDFIKKSGATAQQSHLLPKLIQLAREGGHVMGSRADQQMRKAVALATGCAAVCNGMWDHAELEYRHRYFDAPMDSLSLIEEAVLRANGTGLDPRELFPPAAAEEEGVIPPPNEEPPPVEEEAVEEEEEGDWFTSPPLWNLVLTDPSCHCLNQPPLCVMRK